MDAYDMSDLLKILWSRHYDRQSGMIKKGDGKIKVCVNVGDKVLHVVGLEYNPEGFIELKLNDR